MLALLSLRLTMSFTRRQQLNSGALYLPGRKVAYRACPPWRKCITSTKFIPEGATRVLKAAFDIDVTCRKRTDEDKVVFHLKCPKCPLRKNVGSISLYRNEKNLEYFKLR